MDKKVVLVTGSSSGIGQSTLEVFAKNGYNVVLNYNNNEKKALEIKNNIEKKYNVTCLTIKADVSNDNDVKNMFDRIIEKFNRIDVVVNNAGIVNDSLVEDKTKESIMKIFEVNTYGVFLVSKIFATYMKEHDGGCIINVSSTNGIDTYYPFSLDYDASKAAVINLSHNLANIYGPSIRVNTVCPGWVNTNMNKELDKDFIEEENKKIILNRFADPEEIANVIYFLSTKEASYVNDSVIKIDGGKKC